MIDQVKNSKHHRITILSPFQLQPLLVSPFSVFTSSVATAEYSPLFSISISQKLCLADQAVQPLPAYALYSLTAVAICTENRGVGSLLDKSGSGSLLLEEMDTKRQGCPKKIYLHPNNNDNNNASHPKPSNLRKVLCAGIKIVV